MKNTFTLSRLRASLLLTGCLAFSLSSQSQIINTIAGTGTHGYSGDGGSATAARLDRPVGLVADGHGNLYIGDQNNFVVRKINASGVITTAVGTGTPGYSGDGGPATAAQLSGSSKIAMDTAGNLYIADKGNYVIRKVNTSGTISTIAGLGYSGYSGDGGPATAATFNSVQSIAVSNTGYIYVCDDANQVIRQISPSGIVTKFAGTYFSMGYSGDGGPATAAEINVPADIAVDASGNVYFADWSNQAIRKITTSGIISTVAGNGTLGYSGDGGPATAATLYSPVGVYVDVTGDIYIAEYENNVIRKVNSAGIISTFAGDGTYGFSGDGGPATGAQLNNPGDVVISGGIMYISDIANHRVRATCAAAPSAGSVTGIDSVCPAATTTLTAAVFGGTWYSANTTVATVSGTGAVTGIATGSVNIYYVLATPCGVDTTVFPFTVRTAASCATGMSDMQQQTETLQILPNPNNGSFVIHLSANAGEESTIVITDVLGKKVKEFTASANKQTEVKLNVSVGIYFVIANTSGSRLTTKFIVD